MSDEIMLTIGEDGTASLYDDTYDITIHCESQEEQDEVKRILQNVPHWIPVTKDTPKEAGTYMCTCYDAGRRIVTLAKWQPRTKTWNLIGARAYWKVIAWCKPFEPYKEVTG